MPKPALITPAAARREKNKPSLPLLFFSRSSVGGMPLFQPHIIASRVSGAAISPPPHVIASQAQPGAAISFLIIF